MIKGKESLKRFLKARRPILFLGNGVKLSNESHKVLKLMEAAAIP